MSTDAPRASRSELHDLIRPATVTGSQTAYDGPIFAVEQEQVDLGGTSVTRDVVRHPGAVIVVAMRDGIAGGVATEPEIMLIRQYRHAVGSHLWELPAGLLDEEGEPAWQAAARELAEEVDLQAERWDVLVDTYSSPGMTDESVRFFLARGLSDVPEGQRTQREAEEADIEARWVPLAEAYAAVLAGQVHNSACVIGILAAHGAHEAGYTTLRPHDHPWPEHPANR